MNFNRHDKSQVYETGCMKLDNVFSVRHWCVTKIILFLTLFLSTLFLCADEQPFRWEVRAVSSTEVEVRAVIPEQTYLYAESTAVTLSDSSAGVLEMSPDTVLKADPFTAQDVEIYAPPGGIWRFKVTKEAMNQGVNIEFQGCTSGAAATCFPPESITLSPDGKSVEKKNVDSVVSVSIDPILLFKDYKIIASANGYLESEDFIRFLDGKYQNNPFQDHHFWMVVLLVLIGGLTLNLTPCVLPMLPITLSIIGAGQGAQSQKSGFLRGGVYALGMTCAYGALGLAAVLTGAQFGTLNANPWFNAAIAVIFILLALAMFDRIPLDFSRFGAKYDARGLRQGHLLGVFFLGGVTALLAGACVAPAVIATLLYTAEKYSSGNTAALLLPFLLGLGMALPWPFAGAGLSVLPKPGMWMVKVKYGLGIFIFLLGGYYAYTAYTLIDLSNQGQTETQNGVAAFEQAMLLDKPVVIDFWATWCKNCLHMNATTFKDPAVVKALETFSFIKWQTEKFSDRDVKAILDYFKVSGIPAYFILKKK